MGGNPDGGGGRPEIDGGGPTGGGGIGKNPIGGGGGGNPTGKTAAYGVGGMGAVILSIPVAVPSPSFALVASADGIPFSANNPSSEGDAL